MASPVRVVERFLAGKAKGVSLVPNYRDALEKLDQGDADPALAFAKRLQEVILPGGERPQWFVGLSVQKMNALKSLYREAVSMVSNGEVLRKKEPQHRAEWLRYMAYEMGKWAKDVRTLEIASALSDSAGELQHGAFTVVPVPGLTRKQIDGALAALDEAASKIRPKFPQVLYGKIFLSKHLKRRVAAWYESASDGLALNVAAKKRFNDVYTIIHELGHRHEAKFLKRDAKQRYWELSTQKVYETIEFDEALRERMAQEVVSAAKEVAIGQRPPKMSDELVMWLKSPYPHERGDIPKLTSTYLKGKLDEKELALAVKGKRNESLITGKVLHGPLSVTPYGATNPRENYAEGFAHYVLGLDLPAELASIIAAESR